MDDPASAPLATVVISLRVKEGGEVEYKKLQGLFSETVKQQAGFVATEVFPPVTGIQDEWVVIYRFHSPEQLNNWLGSNTQQTLSQRLNPLLAAPANQQIIIGRASPTETTAVFAHKLRPGCAERYRSWRKQMAVAQQNSPGFLGMESFDPVPGLHDDWVDIVRYADAANLTRWLNSPQRHTLLKELDALVEKVTVHRLGSGLEGWFRLPAKAAATVEPPGWKQFLTVLFALYPIVMLLTIYLVPHLPGGSLAGGLLVSCVISVSLLNWVIMPSLNRVLHHWLAPGLKSAFCEYGVTAGLLAGLAILGVVFHYLAS